jgi:serine/threonine protein kinase
MNQHACPDRSVWQRYAKGLVQEAEQPSLDEHLRYCPACLGRLAESSAEDALEQVLQPGMTLHDATVVAEEMARLKQLARRIASQGGPPRSEDTPPGLSGPSVTHLIHGEETPAETATVQINELLSPPQQPGELGRLGEFRVLRLLGQGGMGVVFAAEDSRLGRQVALKVLRPERARGADSVKRFLREARAMAQLGHENVVSVYRTGEVNGVVYLAMELLHGETLEARIERGPLPLPLVLHIGREAALGLGAAHDGGLIHRDVKPDNIFLQRLGDGPGAGCRVKLLDFGLARALQGEQSLTHPGTVVGTPAYLAPEQADGQPTDARADLFSLGVVLYRLCTGRLPFQGPTLLATLKAVAVSEPAPVRRLAPAVPPALAALIERLLRKDPAGRPASARVVVEALAAIERGDDDGKRPARWGWPRRLALTIAVVLAGVVAAGGLGLWFSGRHDQATLSTGEPNATVAPREDRLGQGPAELSPTDQVKGVAGRLRQLNPNLKGEVVPTIAGRDVLGLEFSAKDVADLSPLRALPRLQSLKCGGEPQAPGGLRDLTPLRGLPLTTLDLQYNKDLCDLRPLVGMPLTRLNLFATAVSDLTPLKDCPLEELHLAATNVTSLAAIRGLRLKKLVLNDTEVMDLTPVEGTPLEVLEFGQTKVRDLRPLRRLRLRRLVLPNRRDLQEPSALEHLPLEILFASEDFLAANRPMFQAMSTLRIINNRPPEQFWKKLDEQQKASKR